MFIDIDRADIRFAQEEKIIYVANPSEDKNAGIKASFDLNKLIVKENIAKTNKVLEDS